MGYNIDPRLVRAIATLVILGVFTVYALIVVFTQQKHYPQMRFAQKLVFWWVKGFTGVSLMWFHTMYVMWALDVHGPGWFGILLISCGMAPVFAAAGTLQLFTNPPQQTQLSANQA